MGSKTAEAMAGPPASASFGRGSPAQLGTASSTRALPSASSASTATLDLRNLNSNNTLYSGAHDELESVSHHASNPPPLLLPPPAFATVAPDIYRCSSSFPTPQDITTASVREPRSQSQGPPAQHVSHATDKDSASSAAGGSSSHRSLRMESLATVTGASSLSLSSLPRLAAQSHKFPGSSPLPSPSLPADRTSSSSPAGATSSPGLHASSRVPMGAAGGANSGGGTGGSSRPRSRVNSNSSTSRSRHTSALSAAAALYMPFLDSLRLKTVLVLGWERPSKTLEGYCRARGCQIVHLGLDGSRIGPPKRARPGLVGTADAPRGRTGVANAEAPGPAARQGGPTSAAAAFDPARESGQERQSIASCDFAASAPARDRVSPTAGSAAPFSGAQIQDKTSASEFSYSAGAGSWNANPARGATLSPHLSAVMSPPLGATVYGSVPGSASPSVPGSSSSSLGSNQPGHHIQAVASAAAAASTMKPPPAGNASASGEFHARLGPTGSSGIMGSLFSASANQAGFISERMVKDGLEIILDKKNHPVMVMDTSGIQETGVLVGCLRRMQRWDFASILVEYRSFAGTRSRTVNERFIEMFDTDLATLPPMDRLPPFFVEHLLQDEEELDRLYGF